MNNIEPPPTEFLFNSIKSSKEVFIEYKEEVIQRCLNNKKIDIQFLKKLADQEDLKLRN
jgi:hypothetical protein